MKRLETTANIAVIVAAVILVVFLGQQGWIRHNSPSRATARSLEGKTVHLPGVQFAAQSRTLIIAISTQCHFCRDSEPFYKELAEKFGSRVNLIAVLPQTQSEAEQYVRQAIAPSVQVVSSPLISLGVTGTPTLLLVDASGRVQKAWVGKLDSPAQQQLQSLL
ncbi:MAG TPA: hypothetical protein VN833_00015 [Candidatus Acidoferrales bacterium]|nr:hypothetical protein [Candidatus Acidoferrales bacterium]